MLHIINRFRKQGERPIDLKRKLNKLVLGLKYGIPFFLISFTGGDAVINDSETIRFDIVKKEKVLGFIELELIKNDKTTKFVINSEVNTKLLFNFKAKSTETYIYKKDILVYSSIYRTINDNVKVDQSIALNKGKYYLSHKKGNELLDIGAIQCNLVRLFFEEPVNRKKVYCDKLKVYVSIIRVNANTYKVTFPNKSYNVFHYRNGKCRLVEAVGSFYKVELIPNHSIKDLEE